MHDKVLDLLIWYIRLVHSLDYYNCTVFGDEDHMPHRCGIITTRPAPPTEVTNEEGVVSSDLVYVLAPSLSFSHCI